MLIAVLSTTVSNSSFIPYTTSMREDLHYPPITDEKTKDSEIKYIYPMSHSPYSNLESPTEESIFLTVISPRNANT